MTASDLEQNIDLMIYSQSSFTCDKVNAFARVRLSVYKQDYSKPGAAPRFFWTPHFLDSGGQNIA